MKTIYNFFLFNAINFSRRASRDMSTNHQTLADHSSSRKSRLNFHVVLWLIIETKNNLIKESRLAFNAANNFLLEFHKLFIDLVVVVVAIKAHCFQLNPK